MLLKRAQELAGANSRFAESSKRAMVVYSGWTQAAENDVEQFCSESLSKWKSALKESDGITEVLKDRAITVPNGLRASRLDQHKARAAQFQASWDRLRSRRTKMNDSKSSSGPTSKKKGGTGVIVDGGIADAFIDSIGEWVMGVTGVTGSWYTVVLISWSKTSIDQLNNLRSS